MLDSLEIAARREIIMDGGPNYHEFIADAVVKEPWNAYSSLFFFVPVAFWIWKLRGRYKENLIIVSILPLLFLNGLGSTLFHAFRAEQLFLYLDFMPAQIMSVILSCYLWTKVLGKWYYGVPAVFGFYALSFTVIFQIIQQTGGGDWAPNLFYSSVGACFLVPIIIILVKTRWYRLRMVLLTFLFLGLALFCRAADYPNPNPLPDIMPQGTHFMWHIFSALAVFTMGYYVYFINKIKLKDKSTYPRKVLKDGEVPVTELDDDNILDAPVK